MIRSLIFTAVAVTAGLAWAGDKVGNGGGAWLCKTPQGYSHGELVDLYEAREEFGLTLIQPSALTSAQSIADERKSVIASEWPEFFTELKSSFDEVAAETRYVNGILVVVDDSLYRLMPGPDTCVGGAWEYTQFANFTNQGQVLIRKDLWFGSPLSNLDKAALLWHEAVYRYLRKKYADSDSIRARQIVGLVFSTLPPGQQRSQIENVLQTPSKPTPTPTPTPPPTPVKPPWACMVENHNESSVFIGYGDVEFEAQTNAVSSCKSSSQDGFFCSASTSCEMAPSGPSEFLCVIRNNLTSSDYQGRGRTNLEANYEARAACRRAPDYEHCTVFSSCQRIH